MRLKSCLPCRLKRRSLLGAAALGSLPITALWAAPEKPDAARFMAAPQMLGAVLSPDGLHVAMRTVAKHGRVVLTVLDLNTLLSTLVYGSEEADVDSVVWVNRERLAFNLADRDTPEGKLDAAPGLFAVNHDHFT